MSGEQGLEGLWCGGHGGLKGVLLGGVERASKTGKR